MTRLTKLLLVVGVTALVIRYWRTANIAGLAAIATVPYLMLAPGLALAIAVVRRRYLSALSAGMVVTLCVASQAQHFLADEPPRHSVEVVAMTLNMHKGQASPEPIVAAVRQRGVDLLMLEEWSADGAKRLIDAGISTELPFNAGIPGVSAEGTGVLSRYPISNSSMPVAIRHVRAAGQATIPGLKVPVSVIAIHPPGPSSAGDDWRHAMSAYPHLLKSLPEGPVIVGGDFNSTPDNPWFRDLLRIPGFANATDQAGTGPIPTYNSQLVPLLAIDHVLTRGAVATHVESLYIPRSDHRAIIATIEVPRG